MTIKFLFYLKAQFYLLVIGVKRCLTSESVFFIVYLLMHLWIHLGNIYLVSALHRIVWV